MWVAAGTGHWAAGALGTGLHCVVTREPQLHCMLRCCLPGLRVAYGRCVYTTGKCACMPGVEPVAPPLPLATCMPAVRTRAGCTDKHPLPQGRDSKQRGVL
jgi:hypothetical protein